MQRLIGDDLLEARAFLVERPRPAQLTQPQVRDYLAARAKRRFTDASCRQSSALAVPRCACRNAYASCSALNVA
jgi:hypothetical protein